MRKLLRAAFVPLALLAVAAMRLAWPRVRVRIGDIWAPRIGHMAGNTDCYLNERAAGKQQGLDFFFFRRPVCNRFMALLVRRAVRVDRTGFAELVDLCNRLFLGWERHTIETAQYDRDIYNLAEKHPAHFKLTAGEERRGAQLRRKLGIPDDAKWVCLIVRDAAYLPSLAYHRHRDTDPDDYIPMALRLVERGYYVVRMGAKVAQPFKVKHTRIIDYATSGKRSDFMDVYLGAHCAFCVSNVTGFDAIPMVFRRPICYVNHVPLEYLMTFVPHSLAIWKHHTKDGKRLHPREVFALNAGQFMRAEEYEGAGIKLESNSPQELIDVAEEMCDRMDWHGFPPDEAQDTFWREFPRSINPYNGKPLHGAIRMRIGAKFLEGYQ